MNNFIDDTIAAISTSTMTSGGISVIRISGSSAIDIADNIFVSKQLQILCLSFNYKNLLFF